MTQPVLFDSLPQASAASPINSRARAPNVGETVRAAADNDVCGARHGGDENSEAANRVTNKEISRARIVAFLKGCGDRGATCEDISIALDLGYTSASARCSELRRDGTVEVQGKRPTRTGCKAAVLVLKEKS